MFGNSRSSETPSSPARPIAIPRYLSEPNRGRSGWENSSPRSTTLSKVSPEHYKAGIECWDYIVSHDLGYLEGNIIKYITRAGKKEGEETLDDLLKAKAYLTKLIGQHVRAPEGSSDLPQTDGPTDRPLRS